MDHYTISLHYTEEKSKTHLDDYFVLHPQIAKEFTVEDSPDEDNPDALILKNGVPIQAYEFKFDDALASRNSQHFQNNLTKMLRTCGTDLPLFVLIADEHKRQRIPQSDNSVRFSETITKPLLGNLFHLAYSMGFQAYYMDADRFAEVLLALIKQDREKIVDLGLVWLERKQPWRPQYFHRPVASKFEISLQPFEGLTLKKAYQLSHTLYHSYRELIWAGTGISAEGEFTWMPEWIDLDLIFPPTDQNEESQYRLKFLREMGGETP